MAAAAYMADRLNPRRAGFSRTIHIHVQMRRASSWAGLLPRVESLLTWLSGDDWTITTSAEKSVSPSQKTLDLQTYETVSLLSGGLDSFSGAVLRGEPTLYISHTDNPTVTGAQRKTWEWLVDSGVASGERIQVSLSERAQKQESTTRTRALLFYALAVAAADARGASTVEVPENGFTSLNLALGGDRGGVLSTRPTHPWTMSLIRALLADVGLKVDLTNPHEVLTKGELVRKASAAMAADEFASGIAATLSCAKLDGRLYKGGNPNTNCGLCVACLTRRASVLAAGLDDQTSYLATSLSGEAHRKLLGRRGGDVAAVRTGLREPIDAFTVLEHGPYPEDYDLESAADLCRRGFAELAAILEVPT